MEFGIFGQFSKPGWSMRNPGFRGFDHPVFRYAAYGLLALLKAELSMHPAGRIRYQYPDLTIY
jgi:hypothetical protein